MKKSIKKPKRVDAVPYQLKTFEIRRASESILQSTFKKDDRNIRAYQLESPQIRDTQLMKKSSSRKNIKEPSRRSSVGPKLNKNTKQILSKQIQQLQIIMKGKKKNGESPVTRNKDSANTKTTVSRYSLLVKQSKKQLPPLDLFPSFKNVNQSPQNQKHFINSIINSSKNSSKGSKEEQTGKVRKFQDFKTLSKQLKPDKQANYSQTSQSRNISDKFKYEAHNNYYNTLKNKSNNNRSLQQENINKQYDSLLKKISKIGGEALRIDQPLKSPNKIFTKQFQKFPNSAKHYKISDNLRNKSAERKERKPTKKMFDFIKDNDEKNIQESTIQEESRKSSLETLINRNDESTSKKDESIQEDSSIYIQKQQQYFKIPDKNSKQKVEQEINESLINTKSNNLMKSTEEKKLKFQLAEKMRKNFLEIEQERKNKMEFVQGGLFEQESMDTLVNQSVFDFYPSVQVSQSGEPSVLIHSQCKGSIEQSLVQQFETQEEEDIIEIDQDSSTDEDICVFEDFAGGDEDQSKIEYVSELNIEDLY